MTKQDFLNELQARLSDLPPREREERLGFYSEMIDDRIEEGLSEEEAVAAIGGIDDAAAQVLTQDPLEKTAQEKPKRRIRAWQIVLLAVCSPIWLSLLLSAVAVVLSLYLVLWVLVICLWAVALSVLGFAVCEIVMAGVFAAQGSLPEGLASLGIGIFGLGATILLFFGCLAASKGVVRLTKTIISGICKACRRGRSK